MKDFWFWILVDRNQPRKRIRIKARDSHTAVRQLPACISWDFAR